MKTLTALLAVGIAAVVISVVCSGPVYAGQASDSPFTLLSTSTSTTTPDVLLIKGGKQGGHHGKWGGHHGKWKGHHGKWHRGGHYYRPYYCSNWVWDGYEYKCYDEFDNW